MIIHPITRREVFVLLCLFTSFLEIQPLQQRDNLEVIEFFAGTGRLCRLANSMGIPAEAHDLSYDELFNEGKAKSPFDINDNAGYLLPSST